MLKLNNPDSLEHRDPKFIRTVAGILQKTIWPYHRAEVRGLDRIPNKNGVIYVGNHNGFPYMTEAFIFTSALFDEFRLSRYPYILMHDFPLKMPLANQFFTKYGCIRASQQNAMRVLEQDEPLLIYPGGDEELMRPHRDRARLRFQGRMGHVRLALKYNRPIVPIAAVGGHSTALILDDLRWLAEAIGAKSKLRINSWPLMLSAPWGLTLGPFIPPYLPWPSKVIVEVLEPIVFPQASSSGATDKARVEEYAQQVERTLEAALARLEAERLSQHGLVQLAQSSAERCRKWLSEFIRQMGSKLAELRQGLGAEASGKHGELPDPDQAFAELLRRATAAPEAAPAVRRPTKVQNARFTQRQILHILEEGAGNRSIKSVCQLHQISESTYYRWRAKYDRSQGSASAPRGRVKKVKPQSWA